MSKLKKLLASLLAVAMLASMGTVVMAMDVVMPRQAFTVCPTCKISPNVVRGNNVSTGSYYDTCLRNSARQDLIARGYYPETTYCPNCGYSQSMNVPYTSRNCNH